MQGLFAVEELKRRFKVTEAFSRSELADAFSSDLERVMASQVTRDIQALYDHKLDRRPVPYDVAIELYLIRLYRVERTRVNDAKKVTAQELLDFINAFEEIADPVTAKWEYAQRFGGGREHFETYVVSKIKASRIKAMSGATINVSAVPA